MTLLFAATTRSQQCVSRGIRSVFYHRSTSTRAPLFSVIQALVSTLQIFTETKLNKCLSCFVGTAPSAAPLAKQFIDPNPSFLFGIFLIKPFGIWVTSPLRARARGIRSSFHKRIATSSKRKCKSGNQKNWRGPLPCEVSWTQIDYDMNLFQASFVRTVKQNEANVKFYWWEKYESPLIFAICSVKYLYSLWNPQHGGGLIWLHSHRKC